MAGTVRPVAISAGDLRRVAFDDRIMRVDESIFSVRGNGRKWAASIGEAAVYPWPSADLVIIGDSTTIAYGAYVQRLRRRLAVLNSGRIGPGWIPAGVSSTIYPLKFGLTTGSAGSTEGDNNYPHTEYGLAGNSYKLNSGSVLTLQTGAGVATTFYGSRLDVGYTKKKAAGSAQVVVTVDGVTAGTIQTTDAAITPAFESGYFDSYNLTPGWHTLTLTGAGGNAAIIDGVYPGDGTSASIGDRVRCFDGGHPSWKLSHFLSATNVGSNQWLTRLDPDAVVIVLGINDYNDGAATYAANMTTFVGETRTAAPDVSLLIVIPYAIASRADWADFVLAIKEVAATLNVPVLDLSWIVEVNAGTTDPHNLVVDSDGATPHTHLSNAGAEVYANELARALGIPVTDPTQQTQPVELGIALSDAGVTAITTGQKDAWRYPFAWRVTGIALQLATASSSGTVTVDVKEGGTTIFSTKPTVAASAKTGGSAAVFSDVDIAADAELTFHVDGAGTGAKGLKAWLYGYRFPT